MTQHPLTPEQERVVAHPLGEHARVLAVAGSGKSTTMAHRIQHLVQERQIRPSAIQALMFNSLARKQFQAHLSNVGLPEVCQPAVHTFHSFSFHILNQLIKDGSLPSSTQFWLADKAELVWLAVKRAINNLEKARRLPPDAVDPEEALSAIGRWKGSLIPPDRAGSYASPHLPLIYAEFERLRGEANALTFDDFIPLAIDLLEGQPATRSRYAQELQHLIVDEYQDVNYGQQRLIELLAGDQADVMVVGDDDQTIYEWRGARPQYILQDFARVFANKPVHDYTLSRSFRFGPLIAQCAANLIARNLTRVEKHLIAHQPKKHGFVQFFQGDYSATRELAEQIQALIQGDKTPPNEVVVLARLYAQLDNLEAEFLSRSIPYRVDGQQPFFKRPEINTLLDYLRLAHDFEKPLDDQSGGWLLNVANKPSRMLSRALLSHMLSTAKYRRFSAEKLFEAGVRNDRQALTPWQAEKLNELWGFLASLRYRLCDPYLDAGTLLDWMVADLGYLEYFQDYYGKGEHADEKKFAVQHFIRYVSGLRLSPQNLLDRLARLDTTQGRPEEELILFTTIFRTKGLEYDYVVLPQCDDNLLPYLKGERVDLFDTQGIVQEAQMSSSLESERRLFYVALTRARKGVLIGASAAPSRFLEELRLASTEALMSAVTHLARGDAQASQSLRQALLQGCFDSSLQENLLDGYLPDLGQQPLAESLRREWAVPSASHVVMGG
ncbi:MAG: ATP-dependent helicase [Anaerolineales bacterium]|nr:ATP-dependent helicase [Anaerolineales bacterium]